MIRRRTRGLTASDLLSDEQRGLEAEYRRLAALKKRDEAQEARLRELAAALTVEQVRFEVATLNTLQYARYEANRRAAIGWVEERTGLAWKDAVKDPQANDLIDCALRWALLNAGVTAVRRRSVCVVEPEPEGDAGDAGGWEPAEYPALDGPTAFEEMPGDLAGALEGLVLSVNPGMFSGPTSAEDAKKNGGISVS